MNDRWTPPGRNLIENPDFSAQRRGSSWERKAAHVGAGVVLGCLAALVVTATALAVRWMVLVFW